MKSRHAQLIAACLAAAMGLAGPAATWADEESPALAKYKKPLDAAVEKALAYLAKTQDKAGYWNSGLGQNTAVASLAVMAFLAKGYTPGTGPYGENINRGIDFVISTQHPNGMLTGRSSHGPMYCHTISTLMLSEVSGMVDEARQKKLDAALAKAVKVIVGAQQVKKSAAHQGGWRYQPNSQDSDMSLTGWALMSLRSARGNGAMVPTTAIDGAVDFVLKCRDQRASNEAKQRKRAKKVAGGQPEPGVGFAYQPGGAAGLARTGVAVLVLELCGKHRSEETLLGGDYILAHPVKTYGEGYFFYALYYCAQAMFQLGGRHWEQFAPQMYEMMLATQSPDGSWAQAAGGEAAGGRAYSTAMAVLAMAVSYRQLPIYQR